MHFQNYCLRNTCLRKCLKNDVLVQPRTVNMLQGRKNCCNLHGSFVSLANHSGKVSLGKRFS